MAPRVTLYVGNLDPSVTNKQLFEHFDDHAPDCNVDFCVIVMDSQTNQSLGYGFVEFHNYDQAAEAMKLLDSTMLMNKPIQVILSPFHHAFSPSVIFIKNLHKSVDKNALFHVLKRYGNIISINLATDASGYAAVRFDCVEAAQTAITDLNGRLFWNYKRLHVSSFLMISEYGFPELAYNKIFIKILSDKITKQYLRDTFSPFGHVTTVSIAEKFPKGQLYGRVAFENSKVADKAAKAIKHHPLLTYLGRLHEKSSTFRPLGEMDAKMIVSKQLHVNLFVKKEEDEQQKTERSQAQFSQMRPIALTSPGRPLRMYPLTLPMYPSPLQMYPLPGQGFRQQIFYPQALPTLIPLQQRGFWYQQ